MTLAGALERLVDSKFSDDRFAGSGGRGNHHRIAAKQGANRIALKVIERKRVESRKLVDLSFDVRIRFTAMPGVERTALRYG